jgi:N-acetylglutamate synthase-like GNAT family acetyltransferase
MTQQFTIRPATPHDADGVTSLLSASYPPLLASGYDADLLARALPLMTRANPSLLRSGTYYVATAANGLVVACGGWTFARPGAPDAPIDLALGHIRHFGTHPGWGRRGLARTVMDCCVAEAKAAGVERLECYSTLVAEPFYRALGFSTVEAFDVVFPGDVRFPSLRMMRELKS